MDIAEIEKLARLIRYYILVSTSEAGSGHATSALSAVELAATLFFKYLHFDLEHPKNPNNDRFILSKGHASPLLYALYAAAGKVSEEELKTLRKFGSPLEGHPTMRFPYTEVPTGSLGQGLSAGVGMGIALRMLHARQSEVASVGQSEAGQNFMGSPQRDTPYVFVLLGDGEMAEGQAWEAIQLAAYYKLNNLIALLDVNRLGQSQQTMYGHDIGAFGKRIGSFGWRVYEVNDGNDLREIDEALGKAMGDSASSQMPGAVIAKTIKGKGVSIFEDKNGWHGKALSKEELTKALEELGEVDKHVRGIMIKPSDSAPVAHENFAGSLQNLPYKTGDDVATRKAYGNALVRLGNQLHDIVVLDGDTKNSTYAELFAKAFPERYFEMFIAEQNMVSAAVGMAKMGLAPFVSTFACFFSRAADQLRMAGLSGQHIVCCGSHAGVSIGEDGPSQMGLTDIALFRGLDNSIVFYPADAVAAERLTQLAYRQKGIVYLRTTRPETPILYATDEEFAVGGSKTHEAPNVKGATSLITIIAVGITVHEALAARQKLAESGIAVRVIDCYSVKPIDSATLLKVAGDSKVLVIVEDHSPVGGLGEAVKSALAMYPKVPVIHLAVYKTPRSGKPEELLDYEGIAAQNIEGAVRAYLKR